MAVRIPTKKLQVHRLGLDVAASDAALVAKRLKNLKNTVGVLNAGPYREDPAYSQVWVDTYWTLAELEAWVDRNSTVDIVGAWARRQEQEIAA